MSFLEKVFGKNNNAEKKENEEIKKETGTELESEKSELNPDQEYLAVKLEAIAEDYAGIDAEKAAENLAKNEEAQQKMKIAIGVLVTAGFLTGSALALTESFNITNLTELQPIVKEVILTLSTFAAAISGALTQGGVEKLRSMIFNRKKAEAVEQNEASIANDSSSEVAA